ncbi:hypothetical protein BDV38DRAFT_282186 [Aspergillus pseudotamarii]|uniref:Dihydrodipicolinate synthase n=1 Tax=Aspergillus pseudotamarii TaxID=132259 RepID=A0A5N6SWS1_ASPPS|nr:uncharacterized protein BDV38DRAFT_282186 [Aspergillus pseudotamarii]KAE8138180.1 hypothetical protein BDV38DRAFT_282186 [Aspergillus pseudotamarii]
MTRTTPVQLTGILTALITPFTDDGSSIDAARLKAHIDRQFDAGIHGLVPGGSTGEFTTLTTEERKQLVELTVKYTAGRGPIIAGVGSTKSSEAIELAVHAAQAGADAVMVVPPFYDPVNYEQLQELLSEIHQASKLPILYYNIPAASGLTLSPEQIAGLSNVGVKWFKDTSGNAPDFTELVFHYGNQIKAMNGWDTLTFYGIAAGNEAVIWGAANFIPELAVELWNALAVKNDLRRGREIWASIWPITKFLESQSYSAAVKTGVELRGLKTGGLRKPFALLKEEHRVELHKLLLNAQVKIN